MRFRKDEATRSVRVDLLDVTIHDLRRSFASLAARMGSPEWIVAALPDGKADLEGDAEATKEGAQARENGKGARWTLI